MHLGACLLVGVAATLVSGAAAPAPTWSPDGRCVAWVAGSEGLETLPGPGWLFDTSVGAVSGLDGGSRLARTTRIEVARVETRAFWTVEESRSPLTAPEWSPSGRALVFGRLDDGGTSFALVIVADQEAGRVLLRRPIRGRAAGAMPGVEFAALGISWSPDGRSIAFTMPTDPPELVVARADNGRVLKTIPGGASPAWSPDGTRLAFLGGGESRSVLVMDSGMGGLKQLGEFSQVFQAPVWSRDGKSVQVAVRQVGDREQGRTETLGLVRIPVDSGSPEVVMNFPVHPFERRAGIQGMSVARDRDGEELFTCLDLPGQPAVVVWSHPRTRETVARMHPLDFSIRVDGMSLSPHARTLALHLGGQGGVVALWDVVDPKLTPLVSDDRSRRAWLALLIGTCRQLSRSVLPAAAVDGKPVERPSLLPVRGEVPWNHEMSIRLRQVAKLGRSLCDRPSSANAAEAPRFVEFLEEARFYFDYLREDYPAALRELEHLESRLTDPADRLRLIELRAQVEIALDNFEQASDVISYLLSMERHAVSRIEITPAGMTLTPEVDARDGWPRYLAHRVQDLVAGRKRKPTTAGVPNLPVANDGGVLFPLRRNPEPGVRDGAPLPVAPGQVLVPNPAPPAPPVP